MDRRSYDPLPWQQRADLFAHLATAEKAGLPAHTAFGMLNLPAPAKARLVLMHKLVKRGAAPIDASIRSGLFTKLEGHILRAAEQGGQLEAAYRQLADAYTLRASTVRKLRARLTPTLFVFFASLLLQKLPQLVQGQIGGAAYVGGILRPLLIVLPLLWLGFSIPRWLSAGEESPLRDRVANALLALPVLGPMSVRRQLRDFVQALALLLAAGVPIFEALPLAESTVSNPLLRADVAGILPMLEAGAPFETALSVLHRFPSERLRALALSGEASGSLAEMLSKFAADATDDIVHDEQNLADWLPRIAYALVAAWMTLQLLGHA